MGRPVRVDRRVCAPSGWPSTSSPAPIQSRIRVVKAAHGGSPGQVGRDAIDAYYRQNRLMDRVRELEEFPQGQLAVEIHVSLDENLCVSAGECPLFSGDDAVVIAVDAGEVR